LRGEQRIASARRDQRALCVGQQSFQTRARHAHAEKVRRDVFELMRFVENDRVVIRNDTRRCGPRSAKSAKNRW